VLGEDVEAGIEQEVDLDSPGRGHDWEHAGADTVKVGNGARMRGREHGASCRRPGFKYGFVEGQGRRVQHVMADLVGEMLANGGESHSK
jgi:hypothetical protein